MNPGRCVRVCEREKEREREREKYSSLMAGRTRSEDVGRRVQGLVN